MQESRYSHGCGIIDDGSGSKEVVVAGDYNLPTWNNAESVEIYSFSDDTWRTGEDFNCY